MPQTAEERKRKRNELMRQSRKQQKQHEQNLVEQVMRLERERAELRSENQQLIGLLQICMFHKAETAPLNTDQQFSA